MIGRLKGVIDEIGDHFVLIDVNGVCYQVYCSSRTLAHFAIGEVAIIDIEMHVREDHIHLYGFAGNSERDWFKLLTTVQGVGARVGLAILGVLGPDDLIKAIVSADDGAVSRAPGVGPKLAKRITSELKDKVGAVIDLPNVINKNTATSDTTLSKTISEAASALVNLGYSPSEALSAVSQVAKEFGADVKVELLIRNGLRLVAPRNLREEG